VKSHQAPPQARLSLIHESVPVTAFHLQQPDLPLNSHPFLLFVVDRFGSTPADGAPAPHDPKSRCQIAHPDLRFAVALKCCWGRTWGVTDAGRSIAGRAICPAPPRTAPTSCRRSGRVALARSGRSRLDWYYQEVGLNRLRAVLLQGHNMAKKPSGNR
jgi:hypothetical protein